MSPSPRHLNLQLDRAFYRPGETAQLTVHLGPWAVKRVPVRLSGVVRHLADPVARIEHQLTLTGADQLIPLAYTPPPESPRGYGVDLRLETGGGDVLACGSIAFDVLDRWTQSPRYGFLTDFRPGRPDVNETMARLSQYHINGLQFYDWMFRHEQLLTDVEPYRDPLGRELSRATVDALIAAAHARGIGAMPYTAVYGASMAFYRQHPQWVLRGQDGQPVFFGDGFLALMDPRPDSPWTRHLLRQYESLVRETGFDGVHLDQYGEPKAAYGPDGTEFPLDDALANLIDSARACVERWQPHAAVVFNAVNNWPIERVAGAAQDFLYIEVWPPHTHLADLHRLIVEAQALGGGKPVVLAAYIDPAWEHNVRLADAAIFASGGAHIELGERDGMLADPYFPHYRPMAPRLAQTVRRYYDFAVRYQEVIGPRTRDATPASAPCIEIANSSIRPGHGAALEATARAGSVWPLVREGKGCIAINLINLVGLEDVEWTCRLPRPPVALGPSPMRVHVDRPVARAWFATPDGDDLAAHLIPFTPQHAQGGHTVALELPSLWYWDLVVLEWME